MKISARIGMVNYINTAPLYEVWRRTVDRPDWRIREGPPAELNRLLFSGELDLGFVSSHEYALHSEGYKMLAGLSISATGPVGSVFLFSELPPALLDDRLVLLSAQSQTSTALVKIILEDFVGVRPRYRVGAVNAEAEESRPAAVLAIGDEALRLAASGRWPIALDLSEVWREHTGLPFVFAVWAVREDFCRRDPDMVVAIHQELLRCIDQGRRELSAISAAVASRIPMAPEDCFRYLRGVEYDLSAEKQGALARYFGYLIARGEVGSSALPLKICG